MDYLVISNLLVVGALFFVNCPNECRGSSFDDWARDYNSHHDKSWRVIPLKRMNSYDKVTIDNGVITPGIEEGVLKQRPTGVNPNDYTIISDPANENLQRDNDEENREVSQQLVAAERRSSRALSPEPLSSVSGMERCQKYLRVLRRLCVVNVLGEAKEQMSEGSIDTADMNNDPTLVFWKSRN